MNIINKKDKWEIVDGKKVIERFRLKATALKNLPKLEKIHLKKLKIKYGK